MFRVSVVIASKNNDLTLESCLKSVLRQSISPDQIEIIVVDAMSLDSTLEILRKYSKYVKVVYDRGEGLPKARNIGLKHSTGQIIIHLDADWVLHPDAIRNCLKNIDENTDAIIPQEGILKDMGFWREVRSWENLIRRFYGKLGEPKSVKEYGYPRVFKKRVLERVGGHNERIRFYGEDAEVYWRLLKINSRIKYCPDVVFHKIEEKTVKEIWEKAYQYGRGTPNLLKYNKRYLVNLIGPFFMMAFPLIPLFMGIIGLFYSKSVRISIALCLCNWLRMGAQVTGIARRIFSLENEKET
jgi:glycosyltransferase involved in cell wall biosynthesis